LVVLLLYLAATRAQLCSLPRALDVDCERAVATDGHVRGEKTVLENVRRLMGEVVLVIGDWIGP